MKNLDFNHHFLASKGRRSCWLETQTDAWTGNTDLVCILGFFISSWVVVSNIFYFHPYLWGKIPILTNIFSKGLKPPTSFYFKDLLKLGIIKWDPFLGSNKQQRYGNFRGFPWNIVHGLGWQYNDPCEIGCSRAWCSNSPKMNLHQKYLSCMIPQFV